MGGAPTKPVDAEESRALTSASQHTSTSMMEGGLGGLNCVVTQSTRDRWVLGSQALVYTQDLIVMSGPAEFVRRCLDSNIPRENLGLGYDVVKYLLSFVFLVVIPACMPVIYAEFLLFYTFGWEKVGSQRIKWSSDHWGLPGFKLFQDNDDFMANNLKIDLVRLRAELANSTEQKASSVVYLDNQSFQSQISFWGTQVMIGALTLFLALVIFIARNRLHGLKVTKQFVCWWLHFSWFSERFPRVKYTSNSLFCGRIKLYQLVPCVWFAMTFSFVVIVPLSIFFLARGDASLDHRGVMALKIMPSCIIGAYAVGNLYLQACNSTFTYWLSSMLEYVITERQFEVELGGIYLKLTKHTDYFVVTVPEIEKLACLRSVEMWLRLATLKACHGADKKQEFDAIKADMSAGNWHASNKRLRTAHESYSSSQRATDHLGHSDAWSQSRKSLLKNCLIRKVYIVDTKADMSFWVDVCQESCDLIKKRGIVGKPKDLDYDSEDEG